MTDTYDGINPNDTIPKSLRRPLVRKRREAPPLYLREWITRLGLSQRAVARGVPLDEGSLSNILNGRRNPSVGMLHDIATFLGLPEAILRQPPPPQNNPK